MEGTGGQLDVVMNVVYCWLISKIIFLSIAAITSLIIHSELQCSCAIYFLVSSGSLLSIDEVSRQPYDSEDFPNDIKALICFSTES